MQIILLLFVKEIWEKKMVHLHNYHEILTALLTGVASKKKRKQKLEKILFISLFLLILLFNEYVYIVVGCLSCGNSIMLICISILIFSLLFHLSLFLYNSAVLRIFLVYFFFILSRWWNELKYSLIYIMWKNSLNCEVHFFFFCIEKSNPCTVYLRIL